MPSFLGGLGPQEGNSNSQTNLSKNASTASFGRIKETAANNRNDSPAFPDFPQPLEIDASNLDDSISIATDQSDDDQFVMLDTADGAPFDDVFRDQGEVAMAEEATEAVAEPATEFLDRIMSEKVSVLTAKLNGVDIMTGTYKGCSRTVLQCEALAVAETNSISLSDVYAKVNDKSFVLCESPRKSTTTSKLPLTLKISSNGVGDKGTLQGEVNGLSATLTDANLANLGAFLEDDSGEQGIGLRIKVNNAQIGITDDRKPDTLRIQVLQSVITQGNVKDESSEEQTDKLSKLEQENARLKQKLEEAKELVRRMAKKGQNNPMTE